MTKVCEWLYGGMRLGTWVPFLYVVAKISAIALFVWFVNRNARKWLDEHGTGSMPEDEGDEVTPEKFKRDPKMRL